MAIRIMVGRYGGAFFPIVFAGKKTVSAGDPFVAPVVLWMSREVCVVMGKPDSFDGGVQYGEPVSAVCAVCS